MKQIKDAHWIPPEHKTQIITNSQKHIVASLFRQFPHAFRATSHYDLLNKSIAHEGRSDHSLGLIISSSETLTELNYFWSRPQVSGRRLGANGNDLLWWHTDTLLIASHTDRRQTRGFNPCGFLSSVSLSHSGSGCGKYLFFILVVHRYARGARDAFAQQEA